MINIQNDSREVLPNDTFIAIKGNNVDGHKYIENAIKNGATKVVVSNNKKYNVETINVKDTDKYLTDYLVDNYAKEFEDLTIIGLTGTNGKTTTAFMTFEMLRKLNVKVAYIGTIGFFYNDNYDKTLNTTPDILRMYKYILKAKENDCKVILIEASSIGLCENRLKGLKYDLVVFTNLTHDHLDYHKTMQNYLKAKLKILDNLKEDGLSITNIDDKYGKYFIIPKRTITYGFNNADIKCIWHDNACINFSYTYKGKKYDITSPLYGQYNIYNIMASLLILDYLGFDLDKVNHLYEHLNPPTGRINLIKYKNNKIIIDYAHTPDGVKQVLSASKNLTTGKTYVIFGCPGDRDRAKRPMMARIVSKYADYFILTDDDPHYEDENRIIADALKGLKANNYEVIIDRKKAIEKGFNLLTDNDTLLILGKGHEESIIVKDKKIPHNDLKYVQHLVEKSNN